MEKWMCGRVCGGWGGGAVGKGICGRDGGGG